jgi:hypothetical protein
MSTPAPITPDADPAALRAEHDDLAGKLEARRSIDAFRRGAYQGFVGLIGVGMSIKLAWDRWGAPKPGVIRKVFKGPPMFFYVAVAITVVVLLLAIRSFLRSRRLGREEDVLFARFRALREALRLDP